MSTSLLINGVEYIGRTRVESISQDEAQKANGQTMQFVLEFTLPLTATVPIGREVVRWYFNGILEFAGRIETVDDLPSSPDRRRIQVMCADWTADFDDKLISYEFPTQLAGDNIRTLVGLVGKGFTSDNVVDGAVVAAKQADLEIPSAIMTAFLEAIEYQWYIDVDRDVHTFYVSDEPAPITTIDLDNDTENYFDFQFTRDYSQVKNRIYLTGAKAKSGGGGGGSQPHTDVVKGDGSDTRFMPLAYEPWGQNDITITRDDGTPQELNVLMDTIDGNAGDGLGGANDAYLCVDNWGVRLPDNFPLANNETLSAEYDYAYEPVIVVEDPESIALMHNLENQSGAPSDGIKEMRFDVPELRVESEDAIWEYGQLLLLRHAQGRIDASFASWVQGWRPGQSFIGTSSDRELDNRRFYIHSVKKVVLVANEAVSGGYFLRYEINCSTSPFPV